MVSVCQKCGDIGFKELLLYCRKCRTYAEHRYCLDKFPRKDEKVRWFCEQCKPASPDIVPLEKFAVKSGRINDDLEFEGRLLDPSDSPPKPRDKILKSSNCGKTVALLKLHNDVVNDSQQDMVEGERSPCAPSERGENRKSNKRRRLILADEHHLDKKHQSDCGDENAINKSTEVPTEPLLALLPPDAASCGEVTTRSQIVAHEKALDEQAVVLFDQVHVNCLGAQPIIDHVWRGCITVGDEKYGPLTAHVSSLACGRVFDAAKLLPLVLHMKKLSRLESLPNCFKSGPPSDDKIGLYFFPESAVVEPMLDLLDDVVQKDLMFKLNLDEVELLVFSSLILPKDHHRFLGNYYLWGAFRKRQTPVASFATHCHSKPGELKEDDKKIVKPNELEEDIYKKVVSVKHTRSAEEGESHNESSNVKQKSIEESDCSAEREEGEICDEYLEREEGEIVDYVNEDRCLSLFPLQVEDMGIVSKVVGSDELNLELGLSRNSSIAADRNRMQSCTFA